MSSFPFITAFVKHAQAIAIAVAVLVALLGVYAGWRCHAPDFVVLGVVFAAGAYLGLRLLGEIVLAIAETLLPR